MITPGVRVIYYRKKHKWRTFTAGYTASSNAYRLLVERGKPTPVVIEAGPVMSDYYNIFDCRRWNIRDYAMNPRGVTINYDGFLV